MGRPGMQAHTLCSGRYLMYIKYNKVLISRSNVCTRNERLESSVADPDQMKPDPEFQVILDPDPRFWWPKVERKKYTWQIILSLVIKTCDLLLPRPSEKRPSYRRRFKPSKENKKWNLLTFSYFCGSGPGSRNPSESRSNPDPDPQHLIRDRSL